MFMFGKKSIGLVAACIGLAGLTTNLNASDKLEQVQSGFGALMSVPNADFEVWSADWTQEGAVGWQEVEGDISAAYSGDLSPQGDWIIFGNGPGAVHQTLSGVALKPESTYMLTVAVGNRNDLPFSGYGIELWAANRLVASNYGEEGGTPPEGEWKNITATYTSGSNVESGQILKIVLQGVGLQANYDNVRLNVRPATADEMKKRSDSAPETVFGDVTKRLTPPVVEPLSTDLPIHEMRAGFVKPPSSAKAKVWWHWMNGNVTREGITADLEAMKHAGVGGAIIFEVDCGIQPGPMISPGDLWLENMSFAAQEAKRLGLSLGLHQSPGWSGSSGPWITPEYSMQVLTWSETAVKGGHPVQMNLPQPAYRKDWYRDVAVFAFPTPVNDVDQDPALFRVETESGTETDAVCDRDFDTAVTLCVPSKEKPAMLTYSFDEPFTVRAVTLCPRTWQSIKGELQASDDGETFRKISDVDIKNALLVPRPHCFNLPEPVTAQQFRLVVQSRGGSGNPEIEIAEFQLHGGNRNHNFYGKSGAFKGDEGSTFKTPVEAEVNPASVLNLTANMDSKGNLNWDAPEGDWTVVRMGHTTTGADGRESPHGTDGLQCGKLSRKALDVHWNAYMQPLLDAVAKTGGRIDCTELDSWEVETQNWTTGFDREFRARRGYDLAAYWPAMVGRIVGNQKETDRFLRDIRRTVADLFSDNHFAYLRELSNRAGMDFYVEAYGNAYFNTSEGMGRSDIPMTEFWANEKPVVSFHEKFAAAPAHVYGKPIVAAEAFTSQARPDSGRWLNTPESMKAVADNKAFCGGINQIVFHRFAHNPWPGIKPGMTMGPYGTHFDGTLTWWDQGRAWLSYLTRCQYVLQQGQFFADVCYFQGNLNGSDAERKNIRPRLPEGYDFDYCGAEGLMMMRVEDGDIVLPSGMRYRYLVPRDAWQMDLDVLEKIRELVADGATVITDRPWFPRGLTGYPESDKKLNTIAKELWGTDSKKKELKFGKGRILKGLSLEEILKNDQLQPDFSYTAPEEKKLGYIHRYTDEAEIYFVSNPQKETIRSQCKFRVSGKVPELWHPYTGETESAPVWYEEDGCTVVDLSFESLGSVFVIFRSPGKEPLHLAECSGGVPSVQGKGIRVDAWSNGTVRARFAGETSLREMKVERVPDPIEIAGPWTVQFDPEWTKPAVGKNGKIIFEQLDDWTQRPEEGIKYYSGTAVYQNTFSVPNAWLKGGRKMVLDLGRVEEMAEVFVNGKPAGILWKKPFEVDVTKWLKAGENQLEVRVVNLWPNRLIGDEQLLENNGFVNGKWPESVTKNQTPPGGRLTFTTRTHWNKHAKPLSSGLLGPVVLKASAPIELRKSKPSFSQSLENR